MPHPEQPLEKSSRRLLKNRSQVRSATSFEELIELVNGLIRPIDRIGELAVYDTALRIGARFGLEPEKVYVHSGTRDGARKLDSDLANRETIEMDELPAPIRKLKPREAEDFLCVYQEAARRREGVYAIVRSTYIRIASAVAGRGSYCGADTGPFVTVPFWSASIRFSPNRLASSVPSGPTGRAVDSAVASTGDLQAGGRAHRHGRVTGCGAGGVRV